MYQDNIQAHANFIIISLVFLSDDLQEIEKKGKERKVNNASPFDYKCIEGPTDKTQVGSQMKMS